MRIAKQRRSEILPLLPNNKPKYQFNDQVLLWLAPDWKKEIAEYYQSGDNSMRDRFDPHQLQRFDEHYSEKLTKRLRPSV
jgi:hypothetical protein